MHVGIDLAVQGREIIDPLLSADRVAKMRTDIKAIPGRRCEWRGRRRLEDHVGRCCGPGGCCAQDGGHNNTNRQRSHGDYLVPAGLARAQIQGRAGLAPLTRGCRPRNECNKEQRADGMSAQACGIAGLDLSRRPRPPEATDCLNRIVVAAYGEAESFMTCESGEWSASGYYRLYLLRIISERSAGGPRAILTLVDCASRN